MFESSGCQSPEHILSAKDPILARIIGASTSRWPTARDEDPVSGLIRIVIAQQISTKAAATLAGRVGKLFSQNFGPGDHMEPDVRSLRACGIPLRKAECCVEVLKRATTIRRTLEESGDVGEATNGIKGIGPWTRSIFRIFIMREPDVLPEGDAALIKAIERVYGPEAELLALAGRWKPFRSVACWYLWRSLGNPPLG